jgi:hypothetical protein
MVVERRTEFCRIGFKTQRYSRVSGLLKRPSKQRLAQRLQCVLSLDIAPGFEPGVGTIHAVWMAIAVSLLCVLLLTGCDSGGESTPAPEDHLLIVWAEGGTLSTWRTEDDQPTTIAGDGVRRVFLSPDGQQIAFTRGEEEQDDSLWLIGVDGSDGGNPRQIEAEPFIRQVAWIDSRTLAFNTLTVDTLGEVPRDDLYFVDTSTDAVTAIEPGGQISVSPGGDYLLLIDPGSYQEQPGRIQAITPTNDAEPVTPMEFPAIATGSHYRFYPAVHWLDATHARVALPDPDAVYHEFDAQTPPVTLWQIAVDGASEQIGTVSASYFGLPQWSADGAAMVYLQRGEDPNLFGVWLAEGDGSDPTLVHAQETPGDLPLPVWIGDSDRFLYIDDNAYWIGHPGESPQRWLDGGEMLLTQSFKIAGSTLVFVALRAASIELRYANLQDDSGKSRLIASNTGTPHFDVIAVDNAREG